jgi:hypothetical protein
MPSGALRVDKYNPKDQSQGKVTLTHRIRQLLYTHQGRDKLFKCVQYLLRLLLWMRGVEAQHFNREEKHKHMHRFSLMERNLMTIINGRKLFRLGRSFSEMVRVRVTFLKCSELLLQPSLNPYMVLFLESQMVVDILARLLFSIKLASDDVGYLARKGFLHARIEDRMTEFGRQFALPVIFFDLYLNTTRLVQGLFDAKHDSAPNDPGSPLHPPEGLGERKKSAFSLLSQYDSMNRMRKSSTPQPQRKPQDRDGSPTPQMVLHSESDSSGGEENTAAPKLDAQSPLPVSGQPTPSAESDANYILVNSWVELLWKDYSLYWVCLTQLKILCDLVVALSLIHQWNHKRTGGLVSTCGLISGLLSVHRVWVYGR